MIAQDYSCLCNLLISEHEVSLSRNAEKNSQREMGRWKWECGRQNAEKKDEKTREEALHSCWGYKQF